MGCDYPSFIQICPLVGAYGISNILQHGGRPPFWLLKIFIFRDVTANEFQICYSVPTAVSMATASLRPRQGHDEMRLPKVHPNRPIGVRVIGYSIFNIFQYAGRPPSWILKFFIFDHMTAIDFQIFCSIPNFLKIGSRIRPPDAHNC